MSQEKMVEELVRQVLSSMLQQGAPGPAPAAAPAGKAQLDPLKDYPLSANRPELLKTPTGKTLADITLDQVMKGEVNADDVRITADTLRMQAEIADGVTRNQFADNLRRAAELTAVPDNRILEIYNALRPYRSTKAELFAIADELERSYNAKQNAAIVREAAEVYERRNRLRAEA